MESAGDLTYDDWFEGYALVDSLECSPELARAITNLDAFLGALPTVPAGGAVYRHRARKKHYEVLEVNHVDGEWKVSVQCVKARTKRAYHYTLPEFEAMFESSPVHEPSPMRNLKLDTTVLSPLAPGTTTTMPRAVSAADPQALPAQW